MPSINYIRNNFKILFQVSIVHLPKHMKLDIILIKKVNISINILPELQIMEDKYIEIERENRILLEKITTIM